MSRSVTILDHGRDGAVRYSGPEGAIEGYWEFGGGDVVTIVSMGSRDEWARTHAQANGARAAILRFVADEAIRQRAPTCVADIDDETGVILLRTGTGKAPVSPVADGGARAQSATFVRRYADVRTTFALIVLAAAAIIGGLMWFGQKAVTVAQGKGVPLNDCVRFDDPGPGGIACLIQRTDPHAPNWSGRGGGETVSISILIVPLNGQEPALIPAANGLAPGSVGLARILGSDGQTLWADAAGLYGVRLDKRVLVTPAELRTTNGSLEPSWWDDPRDMAIIDGKLHIMRRDRSAAISVDPETLIATDVPPKLAKGNPFRRGLDAYFAAGLLTAPDRWMGVYPPASVAADLRPGKWIKPVESAGEAKGPRRLFQAVLEPSPQGARYRIRSSAALGEGEFLNAAFLRMDDASEPVRLTNPAGAVIIHTTEPGLTGTLAVSRVDDAGKVVWTTDTALDRFKLAQILPGPSVVAFVGTKLPVPNKLSEPFVVLVETQTGKATAHSLWR